MRTDAAGWLFLGLAFTFISCTSTKKTTTTSLHTTDTASSFRSKTKVDTASRNSVVKASDVDIYYYYDTAATFVDSAIPAHHQPDTEQGSYTPANFSFPFLQHSGLVAVHVHIGDFSDSSTSSTSHKSIDTTHKQSGQTSQLNQVIVDKKTVIAWWMYVAGGLLLLLLLLFIVYKIVK